VKDRRMKLEHPSEAVTPIRRRAKEERRNADCSRRRQLLSGLPQRCQGTIADVSRRAGIVEQTDGNWVRQTRMNCGEREGLSSGERARATELESR
jgi:hypothetical protein